MEIQGITIIILTLLFFLIPPLLFTIYKQRRKNKRLNYDQKVELKEKENDNAKNTFTVIVPLATFVVFKDIFGYMTALLIAISLLVFVRVCYSISNKLKKEKQS